MRYRLLGRSGLRVSQIALGTMTFGEAAEWSRSEDECRPVFDAYAEVGGNFLDTANMYTGGESERMIGRFVKQDRERFVIATKFGNAVPGRGDPNEAGMHRKNIVQSVEKSLSRLGVDYIDLYYAHFWDFTAPAEEVLRAFDDLVTAGKILHVGLSDVPAWIVSRAQAFHELRGLAPVACMQLEYSLVQRSIEREHIPFSQAHDVAITAWSPLAGGILSGKYTQGAPAAGKGNRMDSMQLQPLDDRNRAIATGLAQLAAEIGAKPAQLALAWIMSRGIIPICGATRAEQMRENIAACELQPDRAVLERLDELSAFDKGHPYAMTKWEMSVALGYAGLRDRIDIPRYPGDRG